MIERLERMPDFERLVEERSVIILTAETDIFKLKIVKGITSQFNVRTIIGMTSDKDINKVLDSLKFKPIFGKRWCLLVEHNIAGDKVVYELIKSYIRHPNVDNVTLVINSEDRKFKQFVRKSRVVRNSKDVIWYDLTYPKWSMLKAYVKYNIENVNGIKIDDYTVGLFVKRLGKHYDEYDSCIKMLTTLDVSVIDSKTLVANIADMSDYGVRDLFECCVLLNRKTVPFKAMVSLVEEHPPRWIYRAMSNSIESLHQAKLLISKGQMIKGSIKSTDLRLMQKQYPDTVLKDKYPLLNMSDWMIDYYLGLATQVSMLDIELMRVITVKYEATSETSINAFMLALLSRYDSKESEMYTIED